MKITTATTAAITIATITAIIAATEALRQCSWKVNFKMLEYSRPGWAVKLIAPNAGGLPANLPCHSDTCPRERWTDQILGRILSQENNNCMFSLLYSNE